MSHPGELVEIRQVQPTEHDLLGELTLEAYTALLGPDLSKGYAAELRDVAGRVGEALVLVAVTVEGAVVGGITYLGGPATYEFASGGEEEVSLRMLAVAPAWQRRGIGTALMQACIDRARCEGRARVFLHTMGSMTTAMRMYERLGFRRAPDGDVVIPEGHLMAYVLDLEAPAGS